MREHTQHQFKLKILISLGTKSIFSIVMEKNVANNMRSLFKRTLSFNKSKTASASPSLLEVPTATTATTLPWAKMNNDSRPQIRVTEPTPVDEPLFPIEDLFERRLKTEVRLMYAFLKAYEAEE